MKQTAVSFDRKSLRISVNETNRMQAETWSFQFRSKAVHARFSESTSNRTTELLGPLSRCKVPEATSKPPKIKNVTFFLFERVSLALHSRFRTQKFGMSIDCLIGTFFYSINCTRVAFRRPIKILFPQIKPKNI